MDFGFTPEQEAFRESIARFARERLAPHYQEDDRRAEFRRELIGEFASLGLLGLRIPEEYGGQSADAVTTGIAGEEIARADLNSGYLLLIPSLVSEIIRSTGDERQRAEWLPQIAGGERLPAFFLTEPERGSDAANIGLRAERENGGWVVTGEKTSISFGADASSALLFARTGGDGPRGVSAFYFDLDDRYLQRSAFSDLGGRSIGRASVAFDRHPVPADALVGAEGEGFVRCMQGFDYSRALIGLMCLGTAQQALDEATAYARERVAFGQPISKQQGVAFPLVEALTQIKGARLLCYEALWRKDQGLPHGLEGNMAKWWAPKLAVEACHTALLVHGHTGYSDEVPAGQRMRDCIGLEIGDGTAQIAKLVAARQLLGREFAP
ncbi:MAG: acyl-CoA dehydrogenase family protein [Solirubrobacterales bacterium]